MVGTGAPGDRLREATDNNNSLTNVLNVKHFRKTVWEGKEAETPPSAESAILTASGGLPAQLSSALCYHMQLDEGLLEVELQ